MKCFKCGATVQEGPLFRQNEKGVKGVFACRYHTVQLPDPELEQIANIVDKAGNPGREEPTKH